MVTPELRRLYEVEKRIDLLRELHGWDGPQDIYTRDAELRAEAEAMLMDEWSGRRHSYTLEVIVDVSHEMPWAPQKPRYVAVMPQEGMGGCIHTVHTASLALARREAVTEHERRQHCRRRAGE